MACQHDLLRSERESDGSIEMRCTACREIVIVRAPNGTPVTLAAPGWTVDRPKATG